MLNKITKQFTKQFTKKIILKKLVIFLIVLWIIITITKKIINSNGIKKYNFIQRNTVAYWLWIALSLYLTKVIKKGYHYFPVVLICLLIIHEIAWYFFYIQITKDEEEVTENFYNWANNIGDTIQTIDIDNYSTDLTEGLFNNNWELTNSEAYKLKYDTYYDYLKLEPGMKLLDIGCGNCQWMNYCKKRGIICTGITISKSQKEFCNKNDIKVILGDVQSGILTTINDKFDAISALGSVEHLCSISQPDESRLTIIKNYYDQVKGLINKNSKSKRYINTYMTTNPNYSNHKGLNWYFNCYLIASTFGYGCYIYDSEISKIYNNSNSKLVINRDYTEDYRWVLIRQKDSWGYYNYKFDNIKKIGHFIADVLIDPSWWQRFLYGHFNSWFWQFGGTKNEPMPENKDTPIRSYIYVTEIS